MKSRERARFSKAAQKLYNDNKFREKIKKLLEGNSAGNLIVPTLQDAIARIEKLEKKVIELEKQLK